MFKYILYYVPGCLKVLMHSIIVVDEGGCQGGVGLKEWVLGGCQNQRIITKIIEINAGWVQKSTGHI
jgi:hypothetical protein